MIAAGLVFAALAALLHVYIFTMESLTWTSPRTRAAFGTTAEEAETTKLLAQPGLLQPVPGDRQRHRHRRGCHGTQRRWSRAHFRRRRIDGCGRGGAAGVVTGQGSGCVDAGHFSVDRYRAAGARPYVVVAPGIPALTPAELLQSRKNVLRSEGKAKSTLNNYPTGVLGYIKWCEERGRRRHRLGVASVGLGSRR
jgi:hypothetical protein